MSPHDDYAHDMHKAADRAEQSTPAAHGEREAVQEIRWKLLTAELDRLTPVVSLSPTSVLDLMSEIESAHPVAERPKP